MAQIEVTIYAHQLYGRIGDRGIEFVNHNGSPSGVTIEGSESDLIALVNDIADSFGWEVSRRDPGPVDTHSARLLAALENGDDIDAHLAANRA